MRILNFGSLNIDNVYTLKEFVRPGETVSADTWKRFGGGKGANQSVALARAGAKDVFHAGRIGRDGFFLKEDLEKEGVDCRFLTVSGIQPSGHAVIQVNSAGQNSIILFGGSNVEIREDDIERTVAFMSSGDILLLQNEISNINLIMRQAYANNMRIFLNPAPMNRKVFSYPLEVVDTFVVNEIEASGLAGIDSDDCRNLINIIRKKYPNASLLLTMGSAGALYSDKSRNSEDAIFVPAEKVQAIDSTAAGDTFIGYFLAGIAAGEDMEQILRRATRAAAISVTREGAQESIPFATEVKL